MSKLAHVLRHASLSLRAEARDGEALYWHDLAQCYFALPKPSQYAAQLLASHGFRRVGEGADTAPASDRHPWQIDTAGQPLFLGSTEHPKLAHLLTGSDEQGYSLMTFAGTPGVYQRSASTIAELFRPSSQWSEHDWAAYDSLLVSKTLPAPRFWSLPALNGQQATQRYLAETANEHGWRQQMVERGLEALVGEQLPELRRQFFDSPPASGCPAWPTNSRSACMTGPISTVCWTCGWCCAQMIAACES